MLFFSNSAQASRLKPLLQSISVAAEAAPTIRIVPNKMQQLPYFRLSVFYLAYYAAIGALTPSHLEGRSEYYGRIRVWGSIGFIAVVALFGVVFDHVSVVYLPWMMLPIFVAVWIAALGNEYGPAQIQTEDDTGFSARLWRR